MSLPDFLLEASRVLIGLGLAVFVGVPLARMGKIFLEGEEEEKEKRKSFLEGEEREEEGTGSADRLGRARFVAAGGLLLGVLSEVQVMGSSLPPRHVWRAGVLFLIVASLVSSAMIVLPLERYYREKSSTVEENFRQPWVSRADAARRRAARIDLFGFLLALIALVLG